MRRGRLGSLLGTAARAAVIAGAAKAVTGAVARRQREARRAEVSSSSEDLARFEERVRLRTAERGTRNSDEF